MGDTAGGCVVHVYACMGDGVEEEGRGLLLLLVQLGQGLAEHGFRDLTWMCGCRTLALHCTHCHAVRCMQSSKRLALCTLTAAQLRFASGIDLLAHALAWLVQPGVSDVLQLRPALLRVLTLAVEGNSAAKLALREQVRGRAPLVTGEWGGWMCCGTGGWE